MASGASFWAIAPMVLASGGSIKKKLHWTIGVEFWAPEFQTARTKFAVENHGAQNSDRWTTHKLCILSSELHSFFSRMKFPMESSTVSCNANAELQENGPIKIKLQENILQTQILEAFH